MLIVMLKVMMVGIDSFRVALGVGELAYKGSVYNYFSRTKQI